MCVLMYSTLSLGSSRPYGETDGYQQKTEMFHSHDLLIDTSPTRVFNSQDCQSNHSDVYLNSNNNEIRLGHKAGITSSRCQVGLCNVVAGLEKGGPFDRDNLQSQLLDRLTFLG